MGKVKAGSVKDPLLFGLVRDYLTAYLPNRRNFSEHTIKTYKYTLDTLLDYVAAKRKIPLAAVTFETIDNKMLSAFLDNVEANGGSVSTRNHKLACIRAFYAYAAKMEPAAVIHHDEIFKVKKSGTP